MVFGWSNDGNQPTLLFCLSFCTICICAGHFVDFYLGGVWSSYVGLVLMWSAYVLLILACTVTELIKSDFSIAKLLLPFVFLLLHVSYGVGTLVGLIDMPFWVKKVKKA